jgi:hypothetical protein
VSMQAPYRTRSLIVDAVEGGFHPQVTTSVGASRGNRGMRRSRATTITTYAAKLMRFKVQRRSIQSAGLKFRKSLASPGLSAAANMWVHVGREATIGALWRLAFVLYEHVHLAPVHRALALLRGVQCFASWLLKAVLRG